MRAEEYWVKGETAFGSDQLESQDWSQTPLGAIETWSDDLKAAVQRHLTELAPAKSTPKTLRRLDLVQNGTANGAASALSQVAQADAFRVRLMNALRPLRDATEIQAIAARILGESLGASRVIYIEVSSDGKEVIVHRNYTNGVAELSGCYRLEEYRRNLTADHQAGYTQIVTDIPNHPEYTTAEKAKYGAIDIAAHIDVPLIKSNQFVALLAVHHSTPRQWTEAEVKQVEETAEQTWAAVERARAEAALRESEAKYRTLFESIDEGFCLIELLFDANDKAINYRFVEINEAFEQQSGLVAVAGKTILELVPNFEPQWAELYGQVAKSGEAVRFEAEVPSLDGVFDIYAFPSGMLGQNLVAVLFANITDRKRREANLAFLAEIQDDCARLITAEEMMQTIGAKIGAYLNISVCAFVDVDETEDRAIVFCAWHRADAPNVAGTYRISQFLSEAFHAEVKAGRVVVVNDTRTDSRTDAASHVVLNLYSFISVPFLRDGQWRFLLNVADSLPRNWCEDEIELFRELANRIFPRLERARAEAALHESEERLRLFVTASSDMVYRMSADWSEMHHLTGKNFLASTQSPNRTWFEQYIPQAVQPQVRAAIEEAIHTKSSFELEHQVIQLDGTVGWTFSRAIPLLDAQNEIIEWFGAATNITDRKQAEDIIATDLVNTRLLHDLSARLISENNIQVMFSEILATAIALTHADAGTVQILDDTTQDILLLAAQGFDRTITDYFYRVDASSKTSCGVALTTGTRAMVDCDVPDCDDPRGSLRLLANAGFRCAQSTPLISRSGKAIGMVSTHWRNQHQPSDQELRFLDLLARQAADLIEQRQTEAERKQILEREQAAREEAERANRIKDEFLAVLSHELRSPLNPILGWTRLLQSGELDAVRQREALDTIERNAKLQTQLIKDLLDISRIMRGKLSLTVALVSLTDVISAALETVRLAAEAKTIQIILDLAPDIALVSGDATRLQQVVWNLLTNAVKFTPNDGQVTVELRQLDRLAQIRVIDTGKGISPQFLPHVFEYFLQEDGSTTRRFGGLGLGLAIARQIVEMHGGRMWAESPGENQGATFVVQMPTTQQRIAIASESTPPQLEAEAPLAGVQVLLVDDEPDTRKFQAFLLEQNGATVTAVASGFEALQVLEQSIPDVLVSDIGMAEMDGYMLLQQIRSREASQNASLKRTIPAIALTAYAAEIDQQQALRVGFQTHLTKPVEAEELVRAIAILLERNSLPPT